MAGSAPPVPATAAAVASIGTVEWSVVDAVREILVALAWRYAFGDLAALVAGGAGGPEGEPDTTTGGWRSQVLALCDLGEQLLELDAEDFGVAPGEPPTAGQQLIPPELLHRAQVCRMPQSPDETPRGALASMRPAFSLLLEVIAARWRRREMAALTAAIHIASEYLPLLAWEPVIGHAADPTRLAASVRPHGSLFGDTETRECAHNRNQRSAAARALRVAGETTVGWRSYLDRQHSHVAHGLGVCAAECRRPCPVMTRLSSAHRQQLTQRCRLALVFDDSAIVRLRHAAPVGHGFGVPSREEVTRAWQHTRERLAGHPGGEAVTRADGFPLPGLPGLFSAVAGSPVRPATLLADVADMLVLQLAEATVQVR